MDTRFTPGGDGLCECGCGQPAPIAKRTTRSRGRIKGQPMRFIRGHNSVGMDRSKPWKQDRYTVTDCGYRTPCWLWNLKRSREGYGSLGVAGKEWLAHRWYYEQAKGSIPQGLQVDHLCRQRLCVNPDHLAAVTPSRNTRRSGSAKLADDEAEVIYELRRDGRTIRSLAAEFGVSKETVRLIGLHGAESVRRPR